MFELEDYAERYAEQMSGGKTVYLLTIPARGCELDGEHVIHLCAFQDLQSARNALQQIADEVNQQIIKWNKKEKKEHEELYRNIKKNYADLWKRYPVRCYQQPLYKVSDNDSIDGVVWIEKMKCEQKENGE